MTTPLPIHPLAKEAADEYVKMNADRLEVKYDHEFVYTPDQRERFATEIAAIIQTTALDPVLKAGELLRRALEEYNCTCTHKMCHRCDALTQWRTLTSPKTGQEGSDGLNSEPAKPPSLPSDEPEAPGTPGDRPRQ